MIERAYTTAEALGIPVWCQDEAGPYQAVPQPGASWPEFPLLEPGAAAAATPESTHQEPVRHSRTSVPASPAS